MWKQIHTSINPQLAYQNMVNQNPDAKRVLDMVSRSNGNLQQLAAYMANQRGIDLNELINEIQSE